MHASYREELWYRLAQEVSNSLPEKGLIAKPQPSASDSNISEQFSPDSMRVEIISGEIKNPAILKGFHVYNYEHIDCEEYMPLATDVLAKVPNKDAVFEAVKNRLKEAGWEGDGELRLMWLPPFLGAGIEDTCGIVLWFVKQDNNGTSWIASPIPLPFQPLLDQQW